MTGGIDNPKLPQERWASWSILLLSFLVYFRILGNGFLNFDDALEPILRNPFLAGWDWNALKAAFSKQTAGYYDPVYVLSFSLDYYLWGSNPAGFHFDNLLLHSVNSVLVFRILLQITEKQSLALLAAYLFTVHPIQVESVCWASNRANVLSLTFALLAFLFYLRGILTSSPGFAGYAAGSIFFLALGMMTKPTVGVLPLIILLTELLLSRHPRPWKSVFLYQGFCWGFLGLYVLLSFGQAVGAAIQPGVQMSLGAHASLFLTLHAYFIKLILFPINLSALYLLKAGSGISFIKFLFAVAIIASFVVTATLVVNRSLEAVRNQPQPSPLLWGIAVYFIGLFPYTNILPRTIYLADRYEYLASIGFCTAAASVICALKRKRLALLAVFSIILFWSILDVDRVAVWRNSSTLWADIDSKRHISPDRRHLNMAYAYAFDGQWAQSVDEYEMAGIERLDDPRILLRFANTLQMAGRDDRAEEIIKKLLNKYPNNFSALRRLVVLYIRQKEYGKSEEILKTFQARMPKKMAGLFNDLIRYYKNEEFPQAARAYRELKEFLQESGQRQVDRKNRGENP